MNIQETIHTVLSAWNVADPVQRQVIAEQHIAEGIVYADPHLPSVITSRGDFLRFLATFRDRVRDVTVALDGIPDVHHQFARCRFHLLSHGSVRAQGTYVIEFDTDGKVARMIGFLD